MKSPYELHGVVVNGVDTDVERSAVCWDCGKENHLHINSESCMFDCKRCGIHGNIYTFLNWLIGKSLPATKASDYVWLSKQKSIPLLALKRANICRSFLNPDVWLLPCYNKDGKLNQVYMWSPDNNRIYATSSLHQTVYLADQIKGHDTIVLAEGHWDTVLWKFLLANEPMDLIGAPGALVYPKGGLTFFAGKHVILAFDNDDAGRKGTDRMVKLFGGMPEKPKSLRYVSWPEDTETGFDLRDLYICQEKSKEMASLKFREYLTPLKVSLTDKNKSIDVQADSVEDLGVEPIPCESFEDLCEVFESLGYRMFPAYREAFATMLAIVISPWLLGPMLWIYLVGPSGIGKTMLCDMLSGSVNYVKAISKMHGLLSGWTKDDGGDASLIPLINHLCMVIKDLTALLTVSESLRDKLFGELRDAYDGYTEMHYNNGVSRKFTDINFGFIAGVTDMIKSYNNTDLGERFLHIDMEAGFTIGAEMGIDHKANRREILECIVTSNSDIGVRKTEFKGKDENKEICRQYTYGFLNHLRHVVDTKPFPASDPNILKRIGHLATLVAAVRTKVKRTQQGELAYKPRQESAFRTAKQLKKMAFGLAIVFQKPYIDGEIWQLVKRIGLETAAGSATYEFSIVKLLSENKFKMSCADIADKIGISIVATRRYLNNLVELETVTVQVVPTGEGQRIHKFGLNPDVKDSWQFIFQKNEA